MELYNVLHKQLNTVDVIDRTEIQTAINGFDCEGQQICYALIKYCYSTTVNSTKLPYGAKIYKNGRLKIDINELPDDLLKILHLFVKKHSERVDIDNLRKNVCL